MLLLTPIVGLLGSLAFVAVLGLSIMPPLLAIILVIGANYSWAIVTVALWFVWLRLGGPARRFVFEGFEHGSI
jgi:hypothetical protein